MAQDSVTTTTTLMSIEDDETWCDASEEYDSWYEVAEAMDNYQEWVDPPIVLGDIDKTEPVNEHIEPDFHNGEHYTGRLKSIISAFNRGYQFLYSMFYKIIYIILFCTFKASIITSKTIVYVLKHCPRLSPIHLSLYPTRLINHASDTPRNIVYQQW